MHEMFRGYLMQGFDVQFSVEAVIHERSAQSLANGREERGSPVHKSASLRSP